VSTKRETEERFSLARWSQRKLEATPGAPAAPAPASIASTAPATPAPVALPPVESLQFDSDFTQFLRPEIDDKVKRAALKQLFRDPRFNVMDGLDTYIDDYTKADPMPPDMLAGLLRRFGQAAGADATQATAAPAACTGPGVTSEPVSNVAARTDLAAPAGQATESVGPSPTGGAQEQGANLDTDGADERGSRERRESR
jgi:uncharacterized protein DUF3306